MAKLYVIWVLCLSLIVSCGSEPNHRYFVSPNGNDMWSGSLSHSNESLTDGPFRTIGKAAQIMVGGDTCFIHEGTYRETVLPLNSGSPGNPMIFMGIPGEKVVISCCDVISDGWQSFSENIFKITLDSVPNSVLLFRAGKLLSPARWPNNSGDLLHPVYAKVKSGTYISVTDTEIPDHFRLEGCELGGFFGKEWAVQEFAITGFSQVAKTIHFPEPEKRKNYYGGPDGWNMNYTPRNGNRYYITGSIELLDHPEEFHLDTVSGDLYVFSKDQTYPSGNPPELKVREYAVDFSGHSWIELHDIDIFGGGIHMDENTNHCLIHSVHAQYVDPGIQISGSYNELNSSELAYCFTAIANVSGEHNRLINNYIHEGNFSGSWEQIVQVSGTKNLISHNTVSGAGGGCISPGGTNNCFQYNDVSVAGLIRHDIGGFYAGNHFGGYNVIHHNRVHDVYGIGIYLDNSSSNYLIHHNAVWNCGWEFVMENPPPPHVSISHYDAIRLNTPSNFILVFNNSCYNQNGGIGYWGRTFIQDMYGDHIINNIFTGPSRFTESAVVSHNLWEKESPGMKEPDSHDFTLVSTSRAIDKGMVISGITDEFSGAAPDLGAFESGKEPWEAGHDFQNPPQPEFGTIRTDFMNLVDNCCFEAGLASWKKVEEGEVEIVQEDSWGLETAHTRMQSGSVRLKPGGGLMQVVGGLHASSSYRLSGWIKQPGKTPLAKIVLGSEQGELGSLSSSSEGWSFVSLEFETGPAPDSVSITLVHTGKEGFVYMDDIGLIEELTSPE